MNPRDFFKVKIPFWHHFFLVPLFFYEVFWPDYHPRVTLKPKYDTFMRKHKKLKSTEMYLIKHRVKISLSILSLLVLILSAILVYSPGAKSYEEPTPAQSESVVPTQQEELSIQKQLLELQKEKQELVQQLAATQDKYLKLKDMAGGVVAKAAEDEKKHVAVIEEKDQFLEDFQKKVDALYADNKAKDEQIAVTKAENEKLVAKNTELTDEKSNLQEQIKTIKTKPVKKVAKTVKHKPVSSVDDDAEFFAELEAYLNE